MQDTKTALKKRLKKLLIISIIGTVLLALVISLMGSASLFILIGSLKYLTTFIPAWEAWYINGVTSGVIGGLLPLSSLHNHKEAIEIPVIMLRQEAKLS